MRINYRSSLIIANTNMVKSLLYELFEVYEKHGACSIQQNKEQSRCTIHRIAPRPVLRARTLHHNVFLAKNISNELGIHPLIGVGKMGAIYMARPCNTHIYRELVAVGNAKRFCRPFCRRITGTKGRAIHIAAIVF